MYEIHMKIIYKKNLLSFTFPIITLLLLVLETNRPRLSIKYQQLNEFFKLFIDDRDKGKFVMTHFYLLVGSIFPFILSIFKETHLNSSNSFEIIDNLILRYSGIACLCVGDSMVR